MLQEGLRERESDELDNRLDALHLCLEKLPGRTREVLDLRYGKGLKGTKVAEMMNRTVDAIYQVLSRAHHSLKGCIENQLANLGTRSTSDSQGEGAN